MRRVEDLENIEERGGPGRASRLCIQGPGQWSEREQ